jgi:hypothetical protein
MCCLLSYTGMRAPGAAGYWTNEITNVGSRSGHQAVLHWPLCTVSLRRTEHFSRHTPRDTNKYKIFTGFL